jgi:hypothetical protein
MIDIYLKAITEEAMKAALIAAELAYEDEEYGLLPASGISLDVIGPIVRVTGYDENDDPITVVYPEYHANLRVFSDLTDEQIDKLSGITIEAPVSPSRVWA